MAALGAIVAPQIAMASANVGKSGFMRKIVPKEKLTHMENLI
jgi:hypothetical protein